jgi:hypothetical protein
LIDVENLRAGRAPTGAWSSVSRIAFSPSPGTPEEGRGEGVLHLKFEI